MIGVLLRDVYTNPQAGTEGGSVNTWEGGSRLPALVGGRGRMLPAEGQPAGTWVSGLWPPELGNDTFLLSFVTTARANGYTALPSAGERQWESAHSPPGVERVGENPEILGL